MKRTLPTLLAAFLLTLSLAALAQESGMWRAVSQNARTITGDIAISGERISINFLSFTIVRMRALEKPELSAVFDAGENASAGGSLYRLEIPASRKFLHKDTLCGDDDVEWMATYASAHSLQVIFFSGLKPPVLTLDGMNSATDICGTYTYAR